MMAETVTTCPRCRDVIADNTLQANLRVCPTCGAHLTMPAHERSALLADPASFRELDRGLVSVDPLAFTDQRSYRDRLLEARRRTGLREAVIIGEARIDGRPVVLVIFEFEFMGGTMGSVVGEKVADAFDHATRHRLPVVSVTASGGARMQEGMLSLMQMAKTAAARARHDRAGLPHISILGHPTFGGVAASFAALGDVLIAEPGALIGFVGPRVIASTIGERLPEDSHRAETLFASGQVDLLVERPRLRETVAYLVAHLVAHLSRETPRRLAPVPPPPTWGRVRRRRAGGPGAAPWEQVQLARHPQRPTTLDYIDRLIVRFVELHGDREEGDDPAVVGGLGEVAGLTVVVIGHERGRTPAERERRRAGMAVPQGYRKALRLMHLAAKFGLPVLTLVDTPGAYPGFESERQGIWQVLARNLAAMASLPTPIVTVVIGEGGSGGALALGLADRVLMLEHAIYSVISPEGAAAILYRDAGRAEEVAAALKLTARDLHRLGIIDAVIPEPPGGAHVDPDAMAAVLRHHLVVALRGLGRLPPRKLLRARQQKYRHIGRVGAYWREVVRTEMQDLLEALETRLLRRAGEHPARPAGEHLEAGSRPPASEQP
ncbi:MAG: acetyl-CoA carboxylase carboxyltransferase subunit alpha [Armatimonadetes bacterium]|nr:acetyl-CoA carboxylase carboxyltransferase subunit alpha [Armatimonadota bacterium]